MQSDLRDDPVELKAALSEMVTARDALTGVEGDGRPAERAKLLRRYWAAVEVVLHSSIRAMLAGKPIDFEVIVLLGSFKEWAGYLAVGQIPGPMKDAASGSARRRAGPTERKHIRAAVTYRRAAELGAVVDPSPTKTVARMYGVTESTAKGWFRDYPPLPLRKADTAEAITKRAEAAGNYYRNAGRSHAAVYKRGRAKG